VPSSEPTPKPSGTASKGVALAIVVAALGYFVDIYDLILFGVVREDSLKGLGYASDALRTKGELLLSVQMAGLLLGGVLWGVLADRKGRLAVLFGSILIYSVANIANGFVTNLEAYVAVRFIAGIGLAGELGAGITLVSELMKTEKRGYGTTLVATFGLLGAIVANLVASRDWGFSIANWRVAYFVGGGLGVLLLVLRIRVFESSLFDNVKSHTTVQRGNLLMLLQRDRLKRYLQSILIGVPIWFVVGVYVFFVRDFLAARPETASLAQAVKTGLAIQWCYIGLSLGDISSGLLSQVLRSRRWAIVLYLSITLLAVLYFYFGSLGSPNAVYAVMFAMGFGTGYWAVFVTVAAEQFGTNLRATVATTVPNFVRGSVSAILPLIAWLRVEDGPDLGAYGSAALVGVMVLILAAWAVLTMPETFHKNLDYYEK